MHIVAIILARGGSKGIPKKNIKDFCGKPLVVWTIEHALRTKSINSVWVSSDDDKILDISQAVGAEIIKRPKKLSSDTATSTSGWLHALEKIEKKTRKVDIVIGLNVTCPLRQTGDIENGINKFIEDDLDSLFSASELGDFYIWGKDINGSYKSINYDYNNRKMRQDFPQQFVENGSFYIFKPEIIRKCQNFIGGKIGLSEMEFWQAFETDSLESWQMCEILMRGYLLK